MFEIPSPEEKIERFDRVFFFILGLTGLIISLVDIPGINGEINFAFDVPFLLIGIVIPLYIGYFRGAIERDSVETRVRGWIYYIVGMSAYFSLITSSPVTVVAQKQLIFIIVGIIGLIVAYFFFKWATKIFGIGGPSCQFSFSATAFSAFTIAFASHLIVLLVSVDFKDKNMIEFGMNSPELFFWLWTLITMGFLVCFFEKGARRVLETKMEALSPPTQMKWLFDRFFLKGGIFGIFLFEYMVSILPKILFLWTQSFAFSLLAAVFWIYNCVILSQFSFLIAIIFSLMGIFKLITTKLPQIKNISNVKTNVFVASIAQFFIIFFMTFLQRPDLGLFSIFTFYLMLKS